MSGKSAYISAFFVHGICGICKGGGLRRKAAESFSGLLCFVAVKPGFNRPDGCPRFPAPYRRALPVAALTPLALDGLFGAAVEAVSAYIRDLFLAFSA